MHDTTRCNKEVTQQGKMSISDEQNGKGHFSGLMATPLDSPNERTLGPGLSSHYGGASGYGSIAGRHGINMDDDFNDYSDGEGSYNSGSVSEEDGDIGMSERGDLEEDDESRVSPGAHRLAGVSG